MNSGLRRSKRQWLGFTIVETMIVLAVTGALFVAIAASLSGRQSAAEFTHAIQSVQSQIQQVVNQVGEGFYPNNANFTCQKAGSSISFTNVVSTQGTNTDCVFLGKVIQFSEHGTIPEAYRIYTIAGLRSATAAVSSPFKNAAPSVVWVNPNYASYTTPQTLEYGLVTKWVRSFHNSGCTSFGCSIGAVGILMESGSSNIKSASGYNSGAQQIDLVPIYASRLQRTPTQTINDIQASAPISGLRDPNLGVDGVLNPSMGVQICFASGSTNQSGLITIGGVGRQLTVSLDIRSNSTCS